MIYHNSKKSIKVTAPKNLNSNMAGKPVELEIENLSDKVLCYRIDEFQIFRVENNQWQKTPDIMKTWIGDDFILDENEVYDKQI